MVDVGLYSALAGVAAITTGVQAAVSLPVAAWAWRETADYDKKTDVLKAKAVDQGRIQALAGLLAVVASGVANGTSLAGWYLVVPRDAELYFILPVIGVTLAAAICGVPALVAAGRYLAHLQRKLGV